MRIGPFGIWEILIILIVVLLVFGPRRLPEMAKGLGQSVRAFRKEMRDIKADLDMEPQAPRAASAAAPANQAATTNPEPASATTAQSVAVPSREGGDGRG